MPNHDNRDEDPEHAAITGFYAAATGQLDWEKAFDRLLAATGFDGAAFYAVDRTSRKPLAERWHRLDTSHAAAYIRDYIPIDPRAAQVFVPNPQRLLYDYLHTAEAEIDRDPFYAWFQPSQSMRYYVGGQSRTDADLPLTLTLHRPRGRGHADAGELATFSRLFDHFEHAVTLQHRLALDVRRGAEALADQESPAHGVVLLDAGLALLHANQAAAHIAARDDALRLSRNGLAAIGDTGRHALAQLLARARAGEVTAPLALARRFGGLPYVLTAYPMRAPGLLAGCGAVAVAVRILDPDASDDGGIRRAAALLGLSPQETAIVARLVEGADPTEIAAELGLKAMTVRTYLAAIYRKTGHRRQGALIARITALARFLSG